MSGHMASYGPDPYLVDSSSPRAHAQVIAAEGRSLSERRKVTWSTQPGLSAEEKVFMKRVPFRLRPPGYRIYFIKCANSNRWIRRTWARNDDT